MKKVTTKLVQDFVLVDELNEGHIIGVQFNDGARGYVLKVSPGSWVVSMASPPKDYSSLWVHPNLKSLANEFISDVGADLFVFDTEAELVNWIYEQYKPCNECSSHVKNENSAQCRFESQCFVSQKELVEHIKKLGSCEERNEILINDIND